MQYSIGEVAALFGLTTEGVRYLEKQGLIQATRKAGSSYRCFDRSAVAHLKEIRTLQSLGFSNAQISERMTRENLLPMLDTHQQRIQTRKLELDRMERCLAHRTALVKWYLTQPDEFRIEQRPEMIFFPRSSSPCADDIACEKAWTMAMPPVTLCGRHYRADGQLEEGYSRFGSSVRRVWAEELGLPLPKSGLILPECLCIHGVLPCEPKGSPSLENIFNFAYAHQLRLSGDVYANLILIYQETNMRDVAIQEVFFPIAPQNDF